MPGGNHEAGFGEFPAIKAEILFFLEKTFQISFGYLGAVVGLAAALNLGAGTKLEQIIGWPSSVLTCVAVLVLNAIYLSTAFGTIFATLKRGLFILQHAPPSSESYRWEVFSRKAAKAEASGDRVQAPHFWTVAWNVDNLYVAPFLGIIMLSSVGVSVLGFFERRSSGELAGIVAGTVFQSVPAGVAFSVIRLQKACTAAARPWKQTTPD